MPSKKQRAKRRRREKARRQQAAEQRRVEARQAELAPYNSRVAQGESMLGMVSGGLSNAYSWLTGEAPSAELETETELLDPSREPFKLGGKKAPNGLRPEKHGNVAIPGLSSKQKQSGSLGSYGDEHLGLDVLSGHAEKSRTVAYNPRQGGFSATAKGKAGGSVISAHGSHEFEGGGSVSGKASLGSVEGSYKGSASVRETGVGIEGSASAGLYGPKASVEGQYPLFSIPFTNAQVMLGGKGEVSNGVGAKAGGHLYADTQEGIGAGFSVGGSLGWGGSIGASLGISKVDKDKPWLHRSE